MSARRLVILISVGLFLLTLASFWRVLGAEFLDYDDEPYITRNRWVQEGPTVESVKWAFTAFRVGNWHPLTWISHMVDVKLYGLNPLGHHLTSLVLHIFSTILLFLLLRRMTGFVWRSAFAAALFALHPLHVESVAWAAERKDVLSTLFWMLTLHAYVGWTKRPGRARYALALVLFALGLMAKPMLVSLPLTLLLIDYWPLRRFDAVRSARRLVQEKAPFFALTGASCIVTFIAQRHDEAVVSMQTASAGVRIANALVSYIAYLVKMVWPAKLALLYPHPFDTIPTWQVIGSALLLAAVSFLVVRAARTRPYLAMGWLWYLITLLPVIGLVQVGTQAMADRYTYVPLIGVFAALTWGIADLCGRRGLCGSALPILGAAVIAGCGVLTWHQTGYWKDSVAIFQRTVDVTKGNHITHTNLGIALTRRGRFKEAVENLQAAIRIKPTAKPYSGIGSAYVGMGRLAEAVPYYKKSLELDPNSASTHTNYGFVLMDLGNVDKAIEHFKEAARLDPEAAVARAGLGLAYARTDRLDDAAREFRAAVLIDPHNPQAYKELGAISQRQGKTDQAIAYLEKSVRIRPDPETCYRLGGMLAGDKKFEEAARYYRRAIDLKPDYAVAHHDLAVALSALGRMDEAIRHYAEAVRISPDYANAHKHLAVALYFRGDFARSWKELGLARKYGAKIDPEFTRALSEKMPEVK